MSMTYHHLGFHGSLFCNESKVLCLLVNVLFGVPDSVASNTAPVICVYSCYISSVSMHYLG